MKTKFLLYLTPLLFSCNDVPKENVTKSELTKNVESNQPKQELNFDEILNITKSEAIKKYGAPLSLEAFILNDGLIEFRIELLNIFSKDEIKSNKIKIEELTWEKDSLNYITVWYQVLDSKRIPVDKAVWEKGTEF